MAKVAYVGAKEGELTITVTPVGFVVTVDLSIPRVPVFTLRVPFDHNPGDHVQMFDEMVAMLQAEMVKYLLAVGVDQKTVDGVYYGMVKAIEEAGGHTDDTKSDRSGAGGDPLLERLIALEPLEVFEIRWDLPEEFSQAIHHHVVTASQQKVTLPDHGRSKGFSTSNNPGTLKQNYPSVRNLVRKFKPQQGKPLTGPAFVLVYDINGRPIGVRSIKGPNWEWMGKKSKLFTRSVKQAARDIYPLQGRLEGTDITVYIDPSRSEIREQWTKNGDCRGFLTQDGQHLFVWDSYVAIHADVADYLKLHGLSASTVIPLILWEGGDVTVTDFARRTRWFHNPETLEVIQRSPALRRALGKSPENVSYFDEAIVGPWEDLQLSDSMATS